MFILFSFLQLPFCDYCLPFTATSSCTKEDSSTEDCDNKGEIPGPAWQAPTGGPPAPHGSQAGGLVPAELGVGASGQHRDLYSRGSDETLRKQGRRPTLLPHFLLRAVLILSLFSRLLLSLSTIRCPISKSHPQRPFAKRRRSVGCARVSVSRNVASDVGQLGFSSGSWWWGGGWWWWCSASTLSYLMSRVSTSVVFQHFAKCQFKSAALKSYQQPGLGAKRNTAEKHCLSEVLQNGQIWWWVFSII